MAKIRSKWWVTGTVWRSIPVGTGGTATHKFLLYIKYLLLFTDCQCYYFLVNLSCVVWIQTLTTETVSKHRPVYRTWGLCQRERTLQPPWNCRIYYTEIKLL